MKQKVAFLLGASGSVGHALLDALLDRNEFQQVIVFTRKGLGHSNAKLVEILVPDMNPATLTKAFADELVNQQAEVAAFTALGVGANTAKLTLEQHRAVDVELNKAFAQALQHSPRVNSLGLLSAVGANPNAKTTGSGAAGMPRYARVKGESEEAVKLNGPKAISIFRPSTILGSQHTPKLLGAIAPVFDHVIPAKFHSVSTQQIAQAMIAASLKNPPAVGVFTYPEMIELIEHRE